MNTLIVTSEDVFSRRWFAAFPDAQIITGNKIFATNINAETLVWVLLEGNWQEYIEYALAAGSKVVAMTLVEDVRQAQVLIATGASGYVHALAEPELLVRVKEVIDSGGAWLGADLLRQLLVNIDKTNVKKVAPKPELTERENAVAICISEGKSNKEVARELDITERTVKAHLSACFNKLNVRDRMQLALAMNK